MAEVRELRQVHRELPAALYPADAATELQTIAASRSPMRHAAPFSHDYDDAQPPPAIVVMARGPSRYNGDGARPSPASVCKSIFLFLLSSNSVLSSECSELLII